MREFNRDKLPKPVQKSLDFFDEYQASLHLVNKPPPTRVLLDRKSFLKLKDALGKQNIRITEAAYRGLPVVCIGGVGDA